MYAKSAARIRPGAGDPENGSLPGTAFERHPGGLGIPLCGVGKEDFEPVD